MSVSYASYVGCEDGRPDRIECRGSEHRRRSSRRSRGAPDRLDRRVRTVVVSRCGRHAGGRFWQDLFRGAVAGMDYLSQSTSKHRPTRNAMMMRTSAAQPVVHEVMNKGVV